MCLLQIIINKKLKGAEYAYLQNLCANLSTLELLLLQMLNEGEAIIDISFADERRGWLV